MSKYWLLFVFAAGTALAGQADNSVLEVGLDFRAMLDGNIYGDNSAVHYDSDTYPFTGDHTFGFGGYAAIGHRFNTKRSDYEFLLKYYFSTTAADLKSRYDLHLDDVSNPEEIRHDGLLREHDLFFTFRLPSTLLPYEFLQSNNLYVDLGAGVTTLVYDYSAESREVTVTYPGGSPVYTPVGEFGDTVNHTITRSGLAFNVGLGYRTEFRRNYQFSLRLDFNIGRIQDIEDANGRILRASPNTNNVLLSVGLIKYFETLF